MTIAEQISALQTDKTNIANAITNKGGTVSAGDGFDDFATDIGTIPTEKPTETFNVTPTTSIQTITPSTGKVFSGGTVQAMPTGALGTVSASKSISGNTATITPSISGGTAGYISETSKTGTAVTVTASEVTSGNKSITAGTSTQTGIDVKNYATASVAPTPSESKTLTLGSSAPSTVSPSSGKLLSSVPVSIDSTVIKAENIAQGATILGIAGTHSGGGGFPAQIKYDGTTIVQNDISLDGVFDNATSIGYYGMYCAYYNSVAKGNVSFPNVTSTSSYALGYAFYKTQITSFSMPNLTGVMQAYTLQYAFYMCDKLTSFSLPGITAMNSNAMPSGCYGCTNLTSVDLSYLGIISNNNCLSTAFRGCTKLETITFDRLTTFSSSGQLKQTFYGCTGLKNIYFPALTSVVASAFGTASSTYTFISCTQSTLTIHFPASMQATIEAMTGYSSKWGATNATILFDL